MPAELLELLSSCKSYTVFDTVEQLAVAALGGTENNTFEVKYDIQGKGEYTEAVVHRVNNGISANYTDPYLRRRDPETMVIADNLPTDKETFKSRFGHDFSGLKAETFEWLKNWIGSEAHQYVQSEYDAALEYEHQFKNATYGNTNF